LGRARPQPRGGPDEPPHHSTETTAPRELGRYRISGGERVVLGQRVLGVVRLSDVPADGRGRRYLISAA
jgi:hypothetical protein